VGLVQSNRRSGELISLPVADPIFDAIVLPFNMAEVGLASEIDYPDVINLPHLLRTTYE